ncbi:unannotated protein [freshwater metagenome]|uniref:Unannotated protein n=1 Tax=freshwater metagenome TaxID=449393 RepID=A0A6J7RPP5_9ZZZZ
MSNAVESPSPPDLMISLKRQLVSSAVPKPANIRMVHNFERYIEAYGPRVYGYTPGCSASSGPYTGLMGIPDMVVYSPSRNFDASKASLHSWRGEIFLASVMWGPSFENRSGISPEGADN